MRPALRSKLASRPNRLTLITPPWRQQLAAGAVEGLVVEHRGRGVVVVQVDAQHVGAGGVARVAAH